MNKDELERLLHETVADALGVTLPRQTDHETAATRIHATQHTGRIITTSWRHKVPGHA